jgi:hypothetical protein
MLNSFLTPENLVFKARSKLAELADKDRELFWSTGGKEIPNHKD